MSQFIETIKVQNKEFQNIEYHSLRYNKTLIFFYGLTEGIDLEKLINIPDNLNNDIYKCRIVYSDTIHKIEFIPYKIKHIKTLKIVIDNEIKYKFKYADRLCFEKLMSDEADDILIVKNEYITDTSFSNIAFYDGIKWVTPSKPLLMGTKLKQLLKAKKIFFEDIKVPDLINFKEARLINAMLDLEDSPSIKIENIFQEIYEV